nr:hemagglutinin repeat-containing protein [Enterovibrio nigricans]
MSRLKTLNQLPLNNAQKIALTFGDQDIEPEYEDQRMGFNDLSIPVIPIPSEANPVGLSIGGSFNVTHTSAGFSRQLERDLVGNISADSVNIVALEGDITLHGNVIEADNGDVIIEAKNGSVYFLPASLKLATQAEQLTGNLGFTFAIGINPSPTTGVAVNGGIGFNASLFTYSAFTDRLQEIGGELTAEQNASISADKGSIKIVGTNIEAGGDILLSALNDIDVEAIKTSLEQYQQASATSLGFNIGGGSEPPFLTSLGFNVKHNFDSLKQTADIFEESSFEAGKSVVVVSDDGSITLAATDIKAGEDISLLAENGKVVVNDTIDNASLDAYSHGAGVNFSWSHPITIGAGFNVKLNVHDLDQQRADVSNIEAGGNVEIGSGSGVTLTGSEVLAGGDVKIDGGTGSVDLLASKTDSSEYVSVNEFGFGFGNLQLGQSGEGSLTLPSVNLNLDFQRLNVEEHIEQGGTIQGAQVSITAEDALNLEGTEISSTSGETQIDVGAINAKAAVSTEKGFGLGFQLGLGVPSYTIHEKPQENPLLPELPSISTGFQAYAEDKQKVGHATVDGTVVDASTLEDKDFEFGVDFEFGIDFSNANAVRGNVAQATQNNQAANVAFGAAAIATALTDTVLTLDIGQIKPDFGWQQSLPVTPGANVEALIEKEIDGIEFIEVKYEE